MNLMLFVKDWMAYNISVHCAIIRDLTSAGLARNLLSLRTLMAESAGNTERHETYEQWFLGANGAEQSQKLLFNP